MKSQISNSVSETDTISLKNELIIYLDEILIMTKYASEQGKDLKKNDLSNKIAKCIELRNKISGASDNDDSLNGYLKDAIEVHSQLSKIIHPVSIASLVATKPGFLNLNHVMRFTIISTTSCLLLLILALFMNESLSPGTSFYKLIEYLKVFLAAWLGAGVYCLWTARRYLIERTYEPRYNPTYTIRLILGVALGTILGLFGDIILSGGETDEIRKLGQVVLSIVGGFSSDAVASLLERIAQTLRAFVIGSNRETVRAEAEKAKNAERNNAANLMLDVKNKISGGKIEEKDLKVLLENIDEYLRG